MSKIFSKPALKALNRIGDIMIPENNEFPAFSTTGCIEHIDDMIAYAPAADIKDLNLLLSILSFMPGFVLRWLVEKMKNSNRMGNGAIADLFRMLDFGLKGLVLGCYYSGKTGTSYKGKSPLQIIACSINRMEA